MNTNKKNARIMEDPKISIKAQISSSLFKQLKDLSLCFLIVIATFFYLAQPLNAEEGISGNLVSVKWMRKILKIPMSW